MAKIFQRKIEAFVGIPVMKKMTEMGLQQSKLVGPKKAFLPNSGVHMNYYEREAVTNNDDSTDFERPEQPVHQPTILFCHGMNSSAMEFIGLLTMLDIPAHIRILIPEQIGHGEEEHKRAFREGDSFQYSEAVTMVEATSEFLDVVNAGPNTHALGNSLGGALVYYLRAKRPDIVQKTVLVAPAITACINTEFVDRVRDGVSDFQCREDVKKFMRDHMWTDAEKRAKRNIQTKDPVPKIAYEVIYQLTKKTMPRGHNKAIQDKLLSVFDDKEISGALVDSVGADQQVLGTEHIHDVFAATSDIDADSHRLVVWPEEDQVCTFEEGKQFFAQSMASGKTKLEPIPECGHCFHDNGTGLYNLVAPRVRSFLLDF